MLIAFGAFGISYNLSTESTIEIHHYTTERSYRAELEYYINNTAVGFVSTNYDTLITTEIKYAT